MTYQEIYEHYKKDEAALLVDLESVGFVHENVQTGLRYAGGKYASWSVLVTMAEHDLANIKDYINTTVWPDCVAVCKVKLAEAGEKASDAAAERKAVNEQSYIISLETRRTSERFLGFLKAGEAVAFKNYDMLQSLNRRNSEELSTLPSEVS